MERYNNRKLSLTISPTDSCNFDCIYCFEKGIDGVFMSEDTENNIIKFIQGYENLSEISIVWYGGEPLLNFKTIISLTKKIEKLNIPFSASIITNGYLLTPYKIKKLLELKITHIQITIDGEKDIHDKRRFLKNGKTTFNKIIENLEHLNLLQLSNKITTHIRVNIDNSNEDSYFTLCTFLEKKIKDKRISNIVVYPAFVTEINSRCLNAQGVIMNREKIAEFYTNHFYNKNFIYFNFFPDNNRTECLARNINGFVIGANGDVYKCWNDIGIIEKAIFNVNRKGCVNYTLIARYLTGSDPFDDAKCQSCEILPICSGGCPYNRIEKEKSSSNEQLDDNICSLFKDNLFDFLSIYSQVQQKKLFENNES